jgi:ABC-type dipeptide/oligopeptide/nickel transport system permease component
MIAYAVRRTLLASLTLVVVSFLSFVIVQLPEGDARTGRDRRPG